MCTGELVAIAMGHGGLLSVFGALVGLVQSERVKEESRRRARGTARVRPLIGALGRPTRVRARAARGKRRRGTKAWRDEDIEAPRLAQGPGPRWPDAVDWGWLQCGCAL